MEFFAIAAVFKQLRNNIFMYTRRGLIQKKGCMFILCFDINECNMSHQTHALIVGQKNLMDVFWANIVVDVAGSLSVNRVADLGARINGWTQMPQNWSESSSIVTMFLSRKLSK